MNDAICAAALPPTAERGHRFHVYSPGATPVDGSIAAGNCTWIVSGAIATTNGIGCAGVPLRRLITPVNVPFAFAVTSATALNLTLGSPANGAVPADAPPR